MSKYAITPERYNDFGMTSYINKSYIPETFCVGSVGQYILARIALGKFFHPNRQMLISVCLQGAMDNIVRTTLYIFR